MRNRKQKASNGASWPPVPPATGLQHLSLNFLLSTQLAGRLVANNSEALRHLEIGLEDIMIEGSISLDKQIQQTLRLCKYLVEYAEPAELSVPFTKLESLRLIALDLRLFFNGSFRPLTNMATLTTLTLECCCGLHEGLPILARRSQDEVVNNLPSLHSLTIRQDPYPPRFLMDLDNFLRSLSPLTTLRVLLSSDNPPWDISEILRIHGTTLRTLLWDERRAPRHILANDVLVDKRDAGKLTVIVEHCPNLVELGLSIKWNERSLYRAHVGIHGKWVFLKADRLRFLTS